MEGSYTQWSTVPWKPRGVGTVRGADRVEQPGPSRDRSEDHQGVRFCNKEFLSSKRHILPHLLGDALNSTFKDSPFHRDRHSCVLSPTQPIRGALIYPFARSFQSPVKANIVSIFRREIWSSGVDKSSQDGKAVKHGDGLGSMLTWLWFLPLRLAGEVKASFQDNSKRVEIQIL